MARVDLGLKTEQLVVFGVSPAMNGYDVERARQVLDGIQDELRAYPGVVGVTTSRVRLISGSASMSDFRLQGVAYGPEDDDSAYYNYVGTDYLRTLGIPLVAGREFLPSDAAGTPKVAIVNEAFRPEKQAWTRCDRQAAAANGAERAASTSKSSAWRPIRRTTM